VGTMGGGEAKKQESKLREEATRKKQLSGTKKLEDKEKPGKMIVVRHCDRAEGGRLAVEKNIGVRQGVAMDSLRFHPGLPCPTCLHP
jgi:hypothetical protein